MAQDVCVGLIGAGAVAQLGHLPAYADLPGVRVTAVCDSDPDKLRSVGAKFDIPNIFDDFESFVRSSDFETVDICLPNHFHAPVAVAALRAGKHVLCEMPFSRSVEEATLMVETAADAGRLLMAGYSHRFRRDTQLLREQIASGGLGEVFRLKAGWLRRQADHGETLWREKRIVSGGGVLLDLGQQLLDLALFLIGNPPVLSVSASMYPADPGEQKVETAATALIHLQTGAAINLEVGWSRVQDPDVIYLNVFGTQGIAEMNPLRILREIRGEAHDVTPSVDVRHHLFVQSFREEIRHMLSCISGEVECISPGEDAVRIQSLVRAIYASASERKEVRFG